MSQLNLKGLHPAPKWILGEDSDLKEWLVHLDKPRFACRVRQTDFTEAEENAPEEFKVFEFGFADAFSDFLWIDDQPPEEELTVLLGLGADFVESFVE
ncbi:MAG: hypothetical protein BGO01_20430 [Armatimonadetes bacterium 55-13]|nr:hypothetical protein [Armatimonadota bacterium]OJU64479.1 MAG: hypothetical protein BGO01_20430 [Armatimonadetes bacterium 55-13]